MFSGVSLATRSSKACFFSSGTAHYDVIRLISGIEIGDVAPYSPCARSDTSIWENIVVAHRAQLLSSRVANAQMRIVTAVV